MVFAILDTETNSVDKNQARAIEIAYMLVDEHLSIKAAGNHYLWDRVTGLGDSVNVHHLTPDFLYTYAEDPAIVCDKLYPILYRANLICHNVDYDSVVIQNEFSRYGYDLVYNSCFCTMKATTSVCQLPSSKRRGYKYPKLSELLEHYKVPDIIVRTLYHKNFPEIAAPEGAQYHNAAYDVCATYAALGMGAYNDVKKYYGAEWFGSPARA